MVIELEEWGNVEESPKHVIIVVEIDSPGWGKELMYKLYIKNGEKWFSFRRATFAEYGLRELQKLADNYDPNQEFFCTHGVGHPLREFTDAPYNLEPLPLRTYTGLEKTEHYWAFGGNHEKYSGAFGYKIFNQELAKQVHDKLIIDGMRSPPDRYSPALYPVEL